MRGGESHHLPCTVDSSREAFVAAIQRTEVDDRSILPKHSANLPAAGQWIQQTILRVSGDQSVLTDPVRLAIWAAAKHAQIGKCSVLPLESMSNKAIAIPASVRRIRIRLGGISKAGERTI